MMRKIALLFFILVSVIHISANSQDARSPIIFIYDASGSMWAEMQGKTKMELALDVMTNTINNLPENQKLGLIAYGHRTKGDCKDVESLVEVETGTKAKVIQALKAIKPLGKTPLAFSAMQVIDKLRKTKIKATVILVTDGIESCDGDLCEVVRLAKKEGIDFKLHIVGFGIKDENIEQLRCAAKEGEGQYYDAIDAGLLGDMLSEATSSTVDEPKNNFSVYVLKNGKSVDAYVKVMRKGSTKALKSVRTYKDSAFFYLPPDTYTFEVKPLEQSDVNALLFSDIRSFSDKMEHKTFSFDASKITISTFNNSEGWDALVHIYPIGQKKSVASGRTYGKQTVFEINPGMYDIEMQAMVIEGSSITHRIENVEIKAGENKQIKKIYESGILMVTVKSAAGLVDALLKITDINSKEIVSNRRTYTNANSNPKKFILNPGKYEIYVKGLGDFEGKVETITVDIKPGESMEKTVSF